jgi:hypothetical protein
MPNTASPADDRRFAVAIPEVAVGRPALVSLITDPAVALHAMSALRRSIGSALALPYLNHHGDRLGKTAASQIRRAEAPVSQEQPSQA